MFGTIAAYGDDRDSGLEIKFEEGLRAVCCAERRPCLDIDGCRPTVDRGMLMLALQIDRGFQGRKKCTHPLYVECEFIFFSALPNLIVAGSSPVRDPSFWYTITFEAAMSLLICHTRTGIITSETARSVFGIQSEAHKIVRYILLC